MSKLHLITFVDDKYLGRERTTNQQCSRYFDVVKNYHPLDLPIDFIVENIDVYSRPRGFGYWVWKPWIMLDYFNNHITDTDDIVMYVDAGDTFDQRVIDSMINHLETNPVYAIHGPHLNKAWTKRDCFILMDCDEEKYWNTEFQIYTSMIACRKSDFTIGLLEEWQKYCKDKNVVTDEPNICGKENFPEFIDHRHDQSIFHNLMIKNDLKTVNMVTPHFWIPES